MALVRRVRPRSGLARGSGSPWVPSEMAELFDRTFRDWPGWPEVAPFPAVNVTHDADRFYVRAELPGIEADELDIAVERNKVTIRGERTIGDEVEGSYHRRERAGGSFARTVVLPEDPNAEGVVAHYTNGVLTVALPKSEAAKRRQITVQTS